MASSSKTESKVAVTNAGAPPAGAVTSASAPGAVPATGETLGAIPSTATPRAELTKEEKRGLFEAYQKADDDVTAAEKALETARRKRSDTIAVIVDRFGKPGPFMWKGDELTAAKLKGGSGFTFRGKKQHDAEDIG